MTAAVCDSPQAHWRIVGYLTRQARVHCVVPIYPLAPHGTAKDVVPATGELLRKLLQDAGPGKVTVGAIRRARRWGWLPRNGYEIPDIGNGMGWC